ncbi:MAG: methylated-DNA--[protein]-cysteine S-methyltransferase [Proteobacteria bacterium]|nr:methylated-DNA--[protein]-cysteine S-methyltransferase [Pseudomonadota bacterium]
MSALARASFASPVGLLVLTAEDDAITRLAWGGPGDETAGDDCPALREARAQLARYFAGRLRDFALPLAPRGTPFLIRAWAALRAIPFGEVRTYGALADMLGTSPRALAGACARNPIPIIVPCHRVVARPGGPNGGLGGYSGEGGLATKRRLLDLEAAHR